jgi:hypothetical protein
MNKISRLILSFFILTSLLSVESYAQSQKFSVNKRGIQLAGYRRCINARISGLQKEVHIGYKIYNAIGQFGYFRRDESPRVICRLAESGETPRFKTLTLSMGFSDYWLKNSGKVKVTVYKDGNRINSIVVEDGEPINLVSDIAGGRDIAIEFSCIEINPNGWCGENLYFFDTSVK